MTDSAHVVPDGFQMPSVETRPLVTQPGVETAPDLIARPPIVPLPDTGTSSREELEMALQRAQLVADDCESLFSAAQRAMEDGAWVSRLADEFSNGLTVHARLAGSVAESCVETIQAALDARGDDEPLEVRPL
ncbi:hypothetical protein [Jiangella rhizosphaerae]|uniref:Uncharacterized protein n=1 Tax=Jiangella rhizosphaerae TaxID=2293569 RepID=A0A418KI20_9ACTN|nr:hypothetical protein [Jiangella rhizosphaerae]RIQ12438.1 hypothetical protein DY240_27070 [Jiangella rhizosphaerae]